MSCKTTLGKIVSPNPFMPSPTMQALSQLVLLPLHPKVKYAISRINDHAQSELKAFERTRFETIKDLGEPVKQVDVPPIKQGDKEIPQPPKLEVITDPEELKSPNLQYQVKKENTGAFEKAMEELMENEVEFKFGPVKVSSLKNAKGEAVDIQFDLAPLFWMLEYDYEDAPKE